MAVILVLLSFLFENFLGLAVLTCFLVVAIIYKYLFGVPIRPEIFNEENLRHQAGEILTDKSLIKQGFSAAKVPPDLDAVVVGSGIGGLTTAAFLAKAGKKVLVLEQHDIAGGSCHTFENKGFEFDIGIHYVGEMEGDTDAKTFLDHLTNGGLKWAQSSPVFDTVYVGDGVYPLCKGYEAFQESLINQFPDERDAIQKYVRLIQSIAGQSWVLGVAKMLPLRLCMFFARTGLLDRFTNVSFYARQSVTDTVKALTGNKRLQAVLSYNYGDLGMSPRKLGVSTQALVYNHFIVQGAFYPRGGCTQIAQHLTRTIEGAGGRVLVRAHVERILLQDGRACGVLVKKGENDTIIHSPLVISDAGIYKTYRNLLPKSIRESSDYFKVLQENVPSEGFAGFSVFVGLRGTTESLSLSSCNHWLLSGEDTPGDIEAYLSMDVDEAVDQRPPILFVSFGSAKDPTWAGRHPDRSVCTIVTLINYDWFSEWAANKPLHRGDEYEALKMAFARNIWNWTLKYFPQLEDKVEHFECGSPLTNNHYICSARGEVYGMEHCARRFSGEMITRLRPQTDTPGLLLTGQDLVTAGFCGGMIGGVLCASAALNRHVYLEMLCYKLKRWIQQKLDRILSRHKQF